MESAHSTKKPILPPSVPDIDRQWVECRIVVREHPVHVQRLNLGNHTATPSSSGRPLGRVASSHGRGTRGSGSHIRRSIKWTVDQALQCHVAVHSNAPLRHHGRSQSRLLREASGEHVPEWRQESARRVWPRSRTNTTHLPGTSESHFDHCCSLPPLQREAHPRAC